MLTEKKFRLQKVTGFFRSLIKMNKDILGYIGWQCKLLAIYFM